MLKTVLVFEFNCNTNHSSSDIVACSIPSENRGDTLYVNRGVTRDHGSANVMCFHK